MKPKIIGLAMKKNPLHFLMPLATVYIILPLIACSSFNRYGAEQSSYIVIFAAQSTIPVTCLLLPMAHFNLWLGNDGWEAIVSCTSKSHACAEGVVILFLSYTTMLIPTFFLFYTIYGFGLLEFLRLCSQCLFVMSTYYFCTIICRNVTLGSLPVVVYLFLCLCLYDRPEYKVFSILDLSNFANPMSILKYLVLCCIAIMLLWYAAKLENSQFTFSGK